MARRFGSNWDDSNEGGEDMMRQECLGCVGDCACYDEGYMEGQEEAQDALIEEVLEASRHEIEEIFKEVLGPLSDKIVLHGDLDCSPYEHEIRSLYNSVIKVLS
jgi:hypothetical protein